MKKDQGVPVHSGTAGFDLKDCEVLTTLTALKDSGTKRRFQKDTLQLLI